MKMQESLSSLSLKSVLTRSEVRWKKSILWHTNRDFTEQEAVFVDEGARYLIEHRLVCSKHDGTIINTDWLKPCFPRFFEYDTNWQTSF